MTVTALFSPDEELASRGVRDPNLRKFLAKRKFKLGLSPEISSLHESIIEKDSPKTLSSVAAAL